MTQRVSRQEKEEKIPSVDVSISEDARESNKILVGKQERLIDLDGETAEIQTMVRNIIKKYPDIKTTMNLRELWTPSKQSRAKSIPRPQNAFMLLRKDVSREFCKANQSLSVRDSSAIASNRWNKISDDKKQFWIDLAEVCKKLHSYDYPNYKYCPERNKPSKSRRADTGRKGKDRKSRREQIAPYALRPSKTPNIVEPLVVPSQTLVSGNSASAPAIFTIEDYTQSIPSIIKTPMCNIISSPPNYHYNQQFNEEASHDYQQRPIHNDVKIRSSGVETSPLYSNTNAYAISTHRPTTRSSAVSARNRQAIINQTAPYPSRHHSASNSPRKIINAISHTATQKKELRNKEAKDSSYHGQSISKQHDHTIHTMISPTRQPLNNQQQFIYVNSANPEIPIITSPSFRERRDSVTFYNTIISPTNVYNSVDQLDAGLIMAQQSYLTSPVLHEQTPYIPTTTYMRPAESQQTYVDATLFTTSPSQQTFDLVESSALYTQPQFLNPEIMMPTTQQPYQYPTDYLPVSSVHLQQTNAGRTHQTFLASPPPPPTSGTEYYYQPSEDLQVLSHQLGLTETIDPALLYQNDPLFTSFSYGRDLSPSL
ncbi:542_t:CDS:1 [Acaulospora colombiana]|uniref:542_t:CDS:1 n=1 Tax=Acaulospora colombiana TaxID=27376 RepID=A0ACA9M9Y4_9GLOM|nr:542_t:CDS:1 [Acaulospora colombiana]